MNLYVSDAEEFPEIAKRFQVVPEMEDSNQVLILPGGLGSVNDMLRAMDARRDIVVFNRDGVYTSFLHTLFQSYEKHGIEDSPFLYMDIEKEYDDVIRKLEEKEIGKINDGQFSQLL